MKSQLINPFLEAAKNVLQQLINISPIRGELALKYAHFSHHYIWIKVGMNGSFNGDILFGLQKSVAMKIISLMMGGMEVIQIDDLGKSAISELGNMITGNASTLLYNQGVSVDISPPVVLEESSATEYTDTKAIVVPLDLGEIGSFDIYVLANT